MNLALGEYIILGIWRTTSFAMAIMSDIDFRAGNMMTKCIDEFLKRSDDAKWIRGIRRTFLITIIFQPRES
jgi:acetyl/propionyl-CoA carboxylase alpha subunit